MVNTFSFPGFSPLTSPITLFYFIFLPNYHLEWSTLVMTLWHSYCIDNKLQQTVVHSRIEGLLGGYKGSSWPRLWGFESTLTKGFKNFQLAGLMSPNQLPQGWEHEDFRASCSALHFTHTWWSLFQFYSNFFSCIHTCSLLFLTSNSLLNPLKPHYYPTPLNPLLPQTSVTS